MANIFEQIASELARGIGALGASEPAEEPQAEAPMRPLPYTPEEVDAVSVGRGIGELQRFVLPSFLSASTGQPIEGSSIHCLRHMPRQPQNALTVNFPDPVYGIWLDPSWTSPGTQVGVGYTSTGGRLNYALLTPGNGIRFKNPITRVNVFNSDGMEQIASAGNVVFPYGYLSFLVALSDSAVWEGPIPKGVANVASSIQFIDFQFPSAGVVPPDGVNQDSSFPIVAVAALQAVNVDVIGRNFASSNAGLYGYCATLVPWYVSAFSKDPIVFGSPITSVDVFGQNFGARWIKGKPQTRSCRSKRAAIDTRNAGLQFQFPIPPGMFALTFTIDTITGPEINTGCNIDTCTAIVYGH